MPGYTKYLAITLVAVFSTVILPKDAWHHCDSELVSMDLNAQKEVLQNQDCPICSFHFSPYESELTPVLFQQGIAVEQQVESIHAYFPPFLLFASSRAPPIA